MTRIMSVPLDEMYTAGVQDPNDPAWIPSSDIAGMQRVDDPNDEYWETTPVVRTAHGVLEFLNHLTEEVHSFLENDTPIPGKRRKLDPIRTREYGSDKWRARQANVTESAAAPLLTQSTYRRRVTFINYGPNVVYLSNQTIASLGATQAKNTIRVPVTGAAIFCPIVLQTRDDVYARCLATQTADMDVIEEFDLEC